MIILICCNDSFSTYTFRRNLILNLMKKNHHVFVVCKGDHYLKKLVDEGINVIEVKMNNTSKNPWHDFLLYLKCRQIVKMVNPDIIINYTIKPHLYMTLAARHYNIKIINFVPGISSMLYQDTLAKKILVRFYRFVSRYTWGYIFLNQDDLFEFKFQKILRAHNKTFVLNSEGVDLNVYQRCEIMDFNKVKFLFVGRLVKEKGLLEYLQAASLIKQKYEDVEFYIAGQMYEKSGSTISMDIIREYEKRGIVKYLGFIENMPELYKQVHVVVLPSYREGMPISLIEALATGRAIIASMVPGSKELVKEKFNGFSCQARDVESLTKAMINYIELSNEDKHSLSHNAHQMAKNFDVNVIVEKQLEILELR
ncbi:MAG TPA: glycosyltransferase family 4 protein [Bacilli bacterium]|nr:glycosyltransferase family 4 protein [Bacilli bacterium]